MPGLRLPFRGTAPRGRAGRWRRTFRLTAAAGLAAALIAGAGFAAFDPRLAAAVRALGARALAASAEAGFAVSDIQAVGRNRTCGTDLLSALGVRRGTPILAVDLQQARLRVESLPWVAAARVERRLPGTLRITLTERVPSAVWQNGGRSLLIDGQGTAIMPVATQMDGLPILTGRGAPEAFAALAADLASVPRLTGRVRSATRLGDRRWNVYLDGVSDGIEIRLPETEVSAAWKRLDELDRSHRLLDRGVNVVDLRLPDRLVVRLVDGAVLSNPVAGRSAPGRQSASTERTR